MILIPDNNHTHEGAVELFQFLIFLAFSIVFTYVERQRTTIKEKWGNVWLAIESNEWNNLLELINIQFKDVSYEIL